MMSSGKRIRELRLKRQKSQKDLANDLGYKTYTTVSKWEADKTLPPANELKKLAVYFQVSTDYLLGLEDYSSVFLTDDILNTVEVNVIDSLDSNDKYRILTETKIEVPKYVLTEPTDKYFVTVVRTDSFSRWISNGDNVVVLNFEKMDDRFLETGNVIIVKIEGSHRILLFRKTDSMIYLEPYSYLDGFETFVYTAEQFKTIEVIGKIVYVFRKIE